ncbi:serine/threonine protein kinase [Actinomadura barringtoniae]|uniref:Serine/threonine protein kinase n=1 Tax=Actinomadura barringtoniae TaxID=1427535 RepID=A0A939PNC0_9ACTN|nr:serine/threonine-protein kinase [Actinomadura barringtoniae]MBO2455492.1 serine/threonine protein kinase [Actinomadura barringtoniae]
MAVTEWRVSGFSEVKELGRGGQGRVVLARHNDRGTPVAIKYLTADADAAAQERLRHEARMLGQVDNPYVAKLYRLVETEQGVAIIMEAVEGVSFKEILQRYGTLEPEAALTVLKGSLIGLAAAHAIGVIHRDYKPANVIVPADGRSKLIDFGIATRDGAASAAGTPSYMAPEQWQGQSASPATDVYAATCVFYECVTGHKPFSAPNTPAMMNQHVNVPVPVEEMPEPLRQLVLRGMAKNPAERPAGAAAFVGELEHVARSVYGSDWESRGVRALAGSALALAALFPLAAAGLVPTATATAGAAGAGASASGAASSSGLIGTLGTKATVAIAGTAVVGAVAGGYGVYQATKPEPKRRPAAATAAPTKPIKVGKISVSVPLTWTLQPLGDFDEIDSNFKTHKRPGDSYFVSTVPGKRCTKGSTDGKVYPGVAPSCPGFFVFGPGFVNGKVPNYLNQPYKESDTFGVLLNEDSGMSCPQYGQYRAVGVAKGAKATVQKLDPVGSHKANFHEWLVPCWTRVKGPNDPEGFGPTAKTATTYTERLWYLPESKILIVDIWKTPNLEAILQKATWI